MSRTIHRDRLWSAVMKQAARTFGKVASKLETGKVDQRVAQEGGGGNYEPPAAGPGLARLVGYIEYGKHANTFDQGKPPQAKLALLFELVGSRHPARVVDGKKVPHFIAVKLTHSLNPKSGFFKLLKQMDPAGQVKHAAQMVLDPDLSGFRVKVSHRTFTGDGGKQVTIAALKGEGGYDIFPPTRPVLDPDTGEETGEVTRVAVPPATSEPKILLWDDPDLEQWDSIAVAGKAFEERDADGNVVSTRSRNVWQDQCKAALNFKGSPLDLLLQGAADIPFEQYNADADSHVSDDDIPF